MASNQAAEDIGVIQQDPEAQEAAEDIGVIQQDPEAQEESRHHYAPQPHYLDAKSLALREMLGLPNDYWGSPASFQVGWKPFARAWRPPHAQAPPEVLKPLDVSPLLQHRSIPQPALPPLVPAAPPAPVQHIPVPPGTPPAGAAVPLVPPHPHPTGTGSTPPPAGVPDLVQVTKQLESTLSATGSTGHSDVPYPVQAELVSTSTTLPSSITPAAPLEAFPPPSDAEGSRSVQETTLWPAIPAGEVVFGQAIPLAWPGSVSVSGSPAVALPPSVSLPFSPTAYFPTTSLPPSYSVPASFFPPTQPAFNTGFPSVGFSPAPYFPSFSAAPSQFAVPFPTFSGAPVFAPPAAPLAPRAFYRY